MGARPRISYESKNRVYKLAEEVEETEPGESRSFREALEVVLDYVEETPESTEPEMQTGEELIQNDPQNINLGENQGGIFKQNNRF